MTKKLPNKISKKLDILQKLLDQIDEARIIDSDNFDTWDSDVLYNLVKNCKEVIQLLEDKKHLKQKDPFGDPIILEEGLCSLIDRYHEEDEEDF